MTVSNNLLGKHSNTEALDEGSQASPDWLKGYVSCFSFAVVTHYDQRNSLFWLLVYYGLFWQEGMAAICRHGSWSRKLRAHIFNNHTHEAEQELEVGL